MAAPLDVNTLNFTGTFVLNKAQSDDTDDMLALQGVNWFSRKIVAMSTLTLYIKQTAEAGGLERIDVERVVTGGLTVTPEELILDWEPREVEDKVFGHIIIKAKRSNPDGFDDKFLQQGWLADADEHGLIKMHVESNPDKNSVKWSMLLAWGFAEVDGERKYVRRMYIQTPGASQGLTKRAVFDYSGPNPRS